MENSNEQTRKRRENRMKLLEALHFHAPLSKTEISDRCSLRKSSTTSIVAELLEEGYISELEPGKVRSKLTLNDSLLYADTFALTPAKLYRSRVSITGKVEIIDEVELESNNPQNCLQIIAGILQKTKTDKHCLGTALAMPGLIDVAGGIVHYAANLNGWNEVNITEEMENLCGVKIKVLNDVHCQMLAAAWFDRYMIEYPDLLYVAVSDGVACRLMLHGREIEGARMAAGEIGHLSCGNEGRICRCGKTDCLEAYCSLPSICNEIGDIFPDIEKPTDAAGIMRAFTEDRRIGNILERAVQHLTNLLAPIVAASDPGLLLLGMPDENLSELMSAMLADRLHIKLTGISAQATTIKATSGIIVNSLRGAGAVVIRQDYGW